MPELPEVEVVARQLHELVCKRIIESVDVYDARLGNERLAAAVGHSILGVRRRAKHVLISLSNDDFLLGHLRMTGSFSVHDHLKGGSVEDEGVVFGFKDGGALCYNSVRRFGHVVYMDRASCEEYFSRFGPEPLEISKKELTAHLDTTSTSPIKNKLLDQAFLSGIGNIYALEALYHARIAPTRKTCSLKSHERSALARALVHVLERGIARNGVSVSNYRHLDGKGSFQDELCVYKQTHCPKKHKITTIKMAGRGTHYCPQCQQ